MLEFFRDSFVKAENGGTPSAEDHEQFAPFVFDDDRLSEEHGRASLLCGACAMACTMEYRPGQGSITFDGPEVCPESFWRDELTIPLTQMDS